MWLTLEVAKFKDAIFRAVFDGEPRSHAVSLVVTPRRTTFTSKRLHLVVTSTTIGHVAVKTRHARRFRLLEVSYWHSVKQKLRLRN